MCELHANAVFKRDPTRTTTLRKQFEAEFYKRFRVLKGRIREQLVQMDGFGLKGNRGRFDFPRSDQKIGAFMEWLREAQRNELIGVSQGIPVDRAARQVWAATYVESAYRRGVQQAASQMRAGGVEVSDRWVEAAFNRPVHADRLGIAYTRMFSELEGITSAMDQQISRELAQGLADGISTRDLARRVNDRVDKIGLTRARTLARTEVVSAHAEASLNSYEEAGIEGVEVEAEWSTAGDDRVCELCEGLEGTVMTIQEARGMLPRHPNCLPGDALVLSRSPIAGVSKRVFDGDMVVINTASGRSLTCTPNHPILTDGGWVAAQSLDVGCDVVCDGGREWEPAGIEGNHQEVVARIHDVAESFLGSSKVASVPVPTAPEDFHGDGAGSEVAIIGSDSSLAVHPQASTQERVENKILKRGRSRLGRLASFGPLAKLLEGARRAAHSVMCMSHLAAPLLRRHLGPLNQLRLGLAPDGHACISQQSANAASVEPNAIGNGLLGLAGNISANNVICPHGHKRRPGPVRISKQSHDDLARDAMLARQLASGDAGKVFADEVVSVDRFAFSGHVYNLETVGNWYSANGIITHNCRCAWIPKVVNGTGVELR